MLVMTPRRPVKVRTEPTEHARPLSHPRPPQDVRRLRDRLADPIPTAWALWGAVAMVGAIYAPTILEPAPANANLPTPWFVTLPNMVVVYGVLAALAGLFVRRRWGMAVSLLSAGIALALVVACPLSGHHHFGLWWVGELGCFGAWAGVSLAGLRQPVPRRVL